MKRFLIALSLCLAFCCTGFGQAAADVPASKEDVDRYMQAIHSHEMMKQVVEAMTKPMPQMVHDQYMKNKEKLPADFEAQMNKSMDDMLQGMSWGEMPDAMAPVYQKHLSKGDIDVTVAFYSAPTGKNAAGNAGNDERGDAVHDAYHAEERREDEGTSARAGCSNA
jgi:hypothetical protein